MKTKQAMKKRRKSQQSNINRNMLTKTKYYWHVYKVMLQMMSIVNSIKH
jgi:hypothetical protein